MADNHQREHNASAISPEGGESRHLQIDEGQPKSRHNTGPSVEMRVADGPKPVVAQHHNTGA